VTKSGEGGGRERKEIREEFSPKISCNLQTKIICYGFKMHRVVSLRNSMGDNFSFQNCININTQFTHMHVRADLSLFICRASFPLQKKWKIGKGMVAESTVYLSSRFKISKVIYLFVDLWFI
jgi:hypothetical protein